ncbi:flagellar hook-associated protein FlgK [Amphritea japonica]|uniref:Flagellar hook-associated protein 1 n=1 Tax=Amphritea japonica ATCC BAA-1530 TaxID=1278309 RepID=A0A7R6PEX7_9GAMM|nr:flagellar hook-associated protein FlgK [Amphritea japonica]BBB25152.1 flagellar hook-associated protein 1 FlgK [Amphritea japonica ATCC BAA-1530]
MSSFNLLSIGNQALQANQSALNTVGQNISNVNTDGYSRQRVDFVSLQDRGGVFVNDIERISDQFMVRQVWSDTSNQSFYSKMESFANELDNLLAAESTSLSNAMNEYFGALQTAVDDPTSLPARQLFLAQADALQNRINAMDVSLTRQNDSINGQIDGVISQINSITPQIASLNEDIERFSASNSVPNEMYDQRDLLIEQLAGFVDISTSFDANGSVDIYIGDGQPLVLNDRGQRLVSVQGTPDATKNEVAVEIGSRGNLLTDKISGGQLGGLIEYRESSLANAANELGRIVMAFSDSMNDQHALGVDLDGELGGLLFRDINDFELMDARVSASTSNNSIIQQDLVQITDVQALKASEYELIFNTQNSFTLTRESDGALLTQSSFALATSAADVNQDGEYYWDTGTNELTVQVDGFKLSLNAQTSFAGGDAFMIRPVRNGASDFAVALTDPRDLALAAPLSASRSIDNTGTGTISVAATDVTTSTFGTAGTMTPAIDIEISDPGTGLIYTVYEQGTATVMATGNYVAGEAIALDGYEVTLSNNPAVGDRFSVNYNTGGVSDNRNALAMSDLQLAKLIEGSSYQDVYGALVTNIGTATNVAQINAQASQAVLDVSVNQRDSISGVNLDEEATKLVQYQQAYSASAKLINVSQTIFDTLLQSI